MKQSGIKVDKKTVMLSVVLAVLPLMYAVLGTAVAGKTVFDVWIPFSGWNDEAFYFRQIQDIVAFGSPRGFWGYNESCAAVGGFGAWNPMILFPMALFGKVFSFSVYTPIIFNLVILGLSLFVFGLICKPDVLKVCFTALALGAFTPLLRLALSCMSEVMLLSFCVILTALYFAEVKKHRRIWQVLMMLILMFLVAIRPYYAVFVLFPLIASHKNRSYSGFLGLLGALVGFLAGSFSEKYLQAPYTEAVYQDWIGKVFTHGPRTVIKEVFEYFAGNLASMFFQIGETVKGKGFLGSFYGTFIVLSAMLFVFFIILVIRAIRHRGSGYDAAFVAALLIGQTAVLMSVLISYNVFDGFRHLFVFMALDIIVLVNMAKEWRGGLTVSLIIAVLMIFFFGFRGDGYAIPPYSDAKDREALYETREGLASAMALTEERSWNNTVLIDSEGLSKGSLERGNRYLDILYALPPGFALNYCDTQYVNDHLDRLKAGFLVTSNGSAADRTALAAGKRVVGETEGYRVYSLR